MSIPHTKNTLGLILRNEIYRDGDCIVTFFTQQEGKYRAMAHGAARIRSRRLGHLDMGTISCIEFRESSAADFMPSITACKNHLSYQKIKLDLSKNSLMLTLLAAVEKALPLSMPVPGLWSLMKIIFGWLEEKDSINRQELMYVPLIFEIKLHTLLGNFPPFSEIQKKPFLTIVRQPLSPLELGNLTTEVIRLRQAIPL